MTQEISASPRVGQTRQGDAIALSRRIGGDPTLLHIDAADYEAQVAGKAAARTESAALSAQLAVGGVASEVAAAKVMITAGLAGSAPLVFRGYWDAATNTPDLLASDPHEGDLWVVSKAGSTDINGQKEWHEGDAAWYRNGAWIYYARAAWAAVAQTIRSLGAVSAGSLTIQDGSARAALELTDDVGHVIAVIGIDGSFTSSVAEAPRFGLTEGGVAAGAIKLLDMAGDAVLSITDECGFLLASIGADGSYRSANGPAAAFGLLPEGIKAGAVQLIDDGAPAGLTVLDANGFLLCHLGGDGSYRSDPSNTPDIGIMDGAVRAGALKLLDDRQLSFAVTDDFGFVIWRPYEAQASVADTPSDDDRSLRVRDPKYTDDASKGFLPGDLWQARGICWRMAYPDKDCAIWRRIDTIPARIGDLFADDVAALYGVRRLKSSYRGPLLDVAIDVAGGTRLVTLHQDERGHLNADDLSAAMSAAKGNINVVRIYDQSGHDNHATSLGYKAETGEILPERNPHLCARYHNGECLISWSTDPYPPQVLRFPSTLSLAASAVTVITTGSFTTINCPTSRPYQAFSLGETDDSCIALIGGAGAESGRFSLAGKNPQVVIGQSSLTPDMSHGVTVLRLDADNRATLDILAPRPQRSTIDLPAGFAAKTLTGGGLGGTIAQSGKSCGMMLGSVAILRRTLGDAEIERVMGNAAATEAMAPQLRDRLDCIGSSTTQGFLNLDGWCWPQMLAEYLSRPLSVRNWAVPGSRSQDFLRYTIENVCADIGQARTAYAITWLGNNDINTGVSIDQIVAENKAIHARLRKAGYCRLLMIGQYNRALNDRLHAAILTGEIDVDCFIDPWGTGPVANRNDKLLFWDTTHPTETGVRFLASLVGQSLNKFL